MKVEYQNTGMAMARFSLYFNEAQPHENDALILKYLEDNRLTPKRVFRVAIGGVPHKVMHYGQCYLGAHLDPICSAAEEEPREAGAPPSDQLTDPEPAANP
jgi:hypothetical protein